MARSNFYPRVFALIVAAILGYALLLIFRPFFGAMTWAAFLAFLLFPLNVRWRRGLRGKSLTAALLTVLAPITILLPLAALSLEFVKQISGLLQALQKTATDWDIKSFADLQQFPVIARFDDWLRGHAPVSVAELQGWLVSGTQKILQSAASLSGTFFLGALDVAGLPSPVVFGVLAALLSLLPIGGAALVWAPAVLWLFFDGRWGYAIFLLAWGLMLGGMDNFLRPMLISGRAKISALAVFVGVMGGIPAFGPIGVIAGPVVLCLVLALIEFGEEMREGAV
jgi:predicted PurR-regulated permease PerM